MKMMPMQSFKQLDTLKFHNNTPLTELLCTWKEPLAVCHKRRPEETPHSQKLNIKDAIQHAFHEVAQGVKSTSELATTSVLLQEEEEKFQEQLKDYNNCMLALKNHNVMIYIITETLNEDPNSWPGTEPAKKQKLVLSCVERWSLWCREVVEKLEGNKLLSLLK